MTTPTLATTPRQACALCRPHALHDGQRPEWRCPCNPPGGSAPEAEARLTRNEQRIYTVLQERGRATHEELATLALGYLVPVNPSTVLRAHVSNMRRKGITITSDRKGAYVLGDHPALRSAHCRRCGLPTDRPRNTCPSCRREQGNRSPRFRSFRRNSLGERIAAYRAREGITVAELAARVGVCPNTLWEWSTRTSPNPKKRAALEALLGANP